MRSSKFKTLYKDDGTYIQINGKSFHVANFCAKVIKETTEHGLDGTTRRYVTMRVKIQGEIKEFEILHSAFEDLTWIGLHLGLDAWIDLKPVGIPTFLAAIIKSSKKRHKISKTKRLGYQVHGGQVCFAYHGGSINADGTVSTSLVADVDGALKHCQFPQCDENDDIRELTQKLLNIANVMPRNPFVGTILLAAVLRAILNRLKAAEITIYLVGKTGSGKTTVALIAQSCFGSGFKKPPTSWESTPKSIELIALGASCILLLIDDFTKVRDNKSALPVIENVIAAVGNGVSRGFALSSTKNSDGATIEALPVITGESIPELMIESRKARTCFVWISSEGDFDKSIIGQYQQDAAAGLFAKAIGTYIGYVLQNYQKIEAEIESVFDRYRSDAMSKLDEGLHDRAPSNYADLMLGFHYFLKFCIDTSCLTKQQAKEIRSYHSDNLLQLINMQPIIHQTQDIKHLVLVEMSKYIRSGQFFLADITPGKKQLPPEKYPKSFIGWVDQDGKHLFIRSDCAKKLIAHLPEDLRKIMSVGKNSFWSDAFRFGLLAEKDIKGGKNVVRKLINGNRERVYSLNYALMYTNHDSSINRKSSKVA